VFAKLKKIYEGMLFMKQDKKHCSQLSIEEILALTQTDIEIGLSQQEASARLKKYGKNILVEKAPDSLFIIFLRQFKNPLVYVLLIAASLAFIVGDTLDVFVALVVVLFNATVGTIQEGRSRNIIAALKKYLVSETIVIRDGQHRVISDEQIVVGDVIVLQEGARVPADARILVGKNLKIEEALLTGESAPVEKHDKPLECEMPIYEQSNMVFRGTFVVSGFGKAVIIATGAETEVGKLQKIMSGITVDMPIKRELTRLITGIVIFVSIVCALFLLIGFSRGLPMIELMVTSAALFICVVPEGLPVVLTLVLVSGAYRMAKRNVLVKRLHAVETLGRINVILTDKTGTLTRNEMMVAQVFVNGRSFLVEGQGYFPEGRIQGVSGQVLQEDKNLLEVIGKAAVLCHTEVQYIPESKLFKIKGEPTEAAIIVFAQKLGLTRKQLEDEFTIIEEIPFSAEKRFQAGFYKQSGQIIAYMIGSPESVIQHCVKMSSQEQEAFQNLLSQGLRVIAVAQKQLTTEASCKEDDLQYMQLVGFLGIHDAIRSGVEQSIAQAREQGIHVAMITGDHRDTAVHVAKEIGLYREGDQVIVGEKFKESNFAERIDIASRATVYARITPDQKVDIVDAYHTMNAIVAMTGDGVNDAPSLAAADVGIAMGNIGTEVAKEAADVVLLDDSFSNIMAGVLEGENVFFALRRVILYFFSTNFGEVLVILVALLLGMPVPLLATQILWLNIVTDGFLDMALSMEPLDKDAKKFLKRHRYRLIDFSMLLKMFYMALPMCIGSVFVFWWYGSTDLVKARTMVLLTMALFQWFNAINCRSEYQSIFSLNPFGNKWLIFAMTIVFGLQLVIIYNPFMNKFFHTVGLTEYDWFFSLSICFSIIIFEEARKAIAKKIYYSVQS
jgi:Ca2+-transporting ATPase